MVNGTITSSETDTPDNSGSIKILGNRIALQGQTEINSSGSNGGGEILIGGNYLGKGPEPNASKTVILEGVKITADALESGDGGRVIVWSDDYTNFSGSITARGTDDGKGGFVETSSKDNLQAFGSVDAFGGITTGEWLLDPANVTIGASTSAGNTYSDFFEPDTTSATVAASSIISALENVHVTITTHNGAAGSGEPGNITVSSSLANINTKSSGRRLTLFAAEDITVSNTISSSGGPLDVRLRAQGNVVIDSNADIITKGGEFKVSGSNDDGDADVEQSINAAAGSFKLSSGSDINTTGGADLPGGAVTIKLQSAQILPCRTLQMVMSKSLEI